LAGTIETTGQGVGPAVEDRVKRIAKIAREEPKLAPFLVDVPALLNDAIDKGEVVFVEGTQGFYLSLYYGTYPYVTSRDTSTSGVCSEVGIPPTKVDEVILVLKSYMTRVGRGPLPGELPPDEALAKGWIEVATVTGRTRRAAPFDFNLARRAAVVDGATQIALTKLDVLFDCAGVRKFEELPKAAIDFVNEVEEKVKVPVTLIGTGPDISDIIDRRKGYFER
jgi:adenylosuccinate synthase